MSPSREPILAPGCSDPVGSHRHRGRSAAAAAAATATAAAAASSFDEEGCRTSRAAARAPTRQAPVAGTASYHERTANVAQRPISELDYVTECFHHAFTIRGARRVRWCRQRLEKLSLVTFQELQLKPAEEVIHDRRRVADLWVS